ncbi:lysine--tRNA ligase cytoplasmic [Gracilaria domingensis]|nr:lysine--tRNA ligase cytoplasmic [Gracilaria domingensis]
MTDVSEIMNGLEKMDTDQNGVSNSDPPVVFPEALQKAIDIAAAAAAEPGLSKNELKRRQKAHRKAIEAAEKAVAKAKKAALKPAKKMDPNAEALNDSGENLDPSQYISNRKAVVKSLKDAGANPYPHKFQVSMTIPEFIEKYADDIVPGQQLEKPIVSLAGRIYSKRAAGTRLVFYDLRGDGVKVQIIADAQKGGASFLEDHARIRRGDIVGVRGCAGKSRKGEFSIFALEVVILSYCLHMLPKLEQGLTDSEVRFRQRYLDLIVNQNNRDIFIRRSKIIKFIRRFLDDRGFLEVETPMMSALPGGATAKPFKTYHEDLKTTMYMRVAPELYLKMLVIGGLERVYEIGRNFRNESIDLTHNPEFTACEFYAAYLDYSDLMEITEQMLSTLVMEVNGTYVVKYHPDGKDGREVCMDFSPPFRRISMVSGLEERLRVILGDEAFSIPKDLEAEATREFLDELHVRLNLECEEPRTTARLLDSLVGEYIEPECINPTFICDHPQIMSPLAKWHRALPGMTERFELFANGKELCNAYTELNDPEVQRERFRVAQKDVKSGDEEAMVYDEDFCLSLEYGLPPTAGWGLGVDRLSMMLTDNYSIKEVLLFPAMKPKTDTGRE